MDILDQFEIEQALKGLEKSKHFIFSYYEIAAELMFKYYQTLIEKGFNKEEALYIVGRHGTFPPMPRANEEE